MKAATQQLIGTLVTKWRNWCGDAGTLDAMIDDVMLHGHYMQKAGIKTVITGNIDIEGAAILGYSICHVVTYVDGTEYVILESETSDMPSSYLYAMFTPIAM